MGFLSGRPQDQRTTNPPGYARYALAEFIGVDKWITHADLSASIRAAITMENLPAMAQDTIVGNNAAAVARPVALTAAQVRALINVANGATANAADAFLLDLANATGSLGVDKVAGLTTGTADLVIGSLILDELTLNSSGTLLPLSFAANSSAGAGYRYVIAPNSDVGVSTGVVSIISGNIDINEGQSSTVVLNRINGVSGGFTITWTVTAGLTTVATGTQSWLNGEPGTKSFTITGAEQASDASGTLTIEVTLGSAGLDVDEVTVDVRHVVPDVPGVISALANWAIIPSGASTTSYLRRSSGVDGDISVDWATTVPGITDPDNGVVSWPDGDPTDKPIVMQAGFVTSNQFATIQLSNPRRTDGGTPAPTLAAASTSTFGIQAPTGSGAVGLTGGDIDVNENTNIPIVATHTGETAGTRTVRWTIGGGVIASPQTGLLTWNPGETGPKSPNPLPVAAFVNSDINTGTIELTELSAGSYGTTQIGLTVRDVPTGDIYTLADILDRYPEITANMLLGSGIAYATPAPPTSTPNTRTVSQQADLAGALAVNNCVITINAIPNGDAYTGLTISGQDQRIILGTGVKVSGNTQFSGTARRIILQAQTPRNMTLGRFQFAPETGACPEDILVDGINSVSPVGTVGNFFFAGRRCAIINSKILIADSWGASVRGVLPDGDGQKQNLIWANNWLEHTAGDTSFGGINPGMWRINRHTNLIVVDSRFESSNPANFQFAMRHEADCNHLFYAGNQIGSQMAGSFDGAEPVNYAWVKKNILRVRDWSRGAGWQTHSPPTSGSLASKTNLFIVDNDMRGDMSWPTADNEVGGTWTVSGNTVVSDTSGVSLPAWNFETWQSTPGTGGGGTGSGSYTLANAIAGVPFSVSLPASPVITTTVDVTPANIGSYIGLTGRRLRLGAGTYGRLNLNVPDMELVLTTGVTVEEILVSHLAPRVRVTASPVRSGRIGSITVGTSDEGTVSNGLTLSIAGSLPRDVTFDGINQDWYTGCRKANYFNANRIALLNSYLKQVVSAFIIWDSPGAPGARASDVIVGNTDLVQEYSYDSIGTNNGFGWRTQGTQKLVMVDSRLTCTPVTQGAPWSLRVHGGNTANGVTEAIATDHYYSRNRYVGTATAMQRSGDGLNPGNLSNVRFVNNTMYFAVTSMPAINFGNDAASIPQSGGLTIQNNTVYGSQGIVIPVGYNYNAVNNQRFDYVTPPAWNFL